MPLRHKGKNAGITYSQSFAQWEAAHAANLDLYLWDCTDHYPKFFKAKVVKWYGLHLAVKNHLKDANMPTKKPKSGKRPVRRRR